LQIITHTKANPEPARVFGVVSIRQTNWQDYSKIALPTVLEAGSIVIFWRIKTIHHTIISPPFRFALCGQKLSWEWRIAYYSNILAARHKELPILNAYSKPSTINLSDQSISTSHKNKTCTNSLPAYSTASTCIASI